MTALNDTVVRLDINAGGYGWYVDTTPGDDDEFETAPRVNAGGRSDKGQNTPALLPGLSRMFTTPDKAPAGRMDLLTVVMHELGHVIGKDSTFDESDRDELMYAYLVTGERRLPSVGVRLSRARRAEAADRGRGRAASLPVGPAAATRQWIARLFW
ncbi:MAG: hypothetical protein IT462_00555 [Planctomycetes bacterium]|nr:hypothetical protein [Planctomycetota bacterium]